MADQDIFDTFTKPEPSRVYNTHAFSFSLRYISEDTLSFVGLLAFSACLPTLFALSSCLRPHLFHHRLSSSSPSHQHHTVPCSQFPPSPPSQLGSRKSCPSLRRSLYLCEKETGEELAPREMGVQARILQSSP